jgi:hypothetical protein
LDLNATALRPLQDVAIRRGKIELRAIAPTRGLTLRIGSGTLRAQAVEKVDGKEENQRWETE